MPAQAVGRKRAPRRSARGEAARWRDRSQSRLCPNEAKTNERTGDARAKPRPRAVVFGADASGLSPKIAKSVCWSRRMLSVLRCPQAKPRRQKPVNRPRQVPVARFQAERRPGQEKKAVAASIPAKA